MRPAVTRPAAFVGLDARGTLFAVADQCDAFSLHALGHEIVARRLRSSLPESEVVCRRAARVAVTLDEDDGPGVGLHPRDVGRHRTLALSADLVAIEVEEHVLQFPDLSELAWVRSPPAGGTGGRGRSAGGSPR